MALFLDANGQLVVADVMPQGGSVVSSAPSQNLPDIAPWFRTLDDGTTQWNPANYYAGASETLSIGSFVKVQFSVDGLTAWHDVAAVNDVYMRSGTSVDGVNYVYEGAVKIKGDDGKNGLNGTNGLNGANGKDGLNGANGLNGSNGTNGDTAVRVYQLVAVSSPDPSAPANGTAFPPTNWSSSQYTIGVNQKQYQCDGIKKGSTGYITWTTPYLSVFKVGKLEAFTAYVGSLKSGDDAKRLTINEGDSHEFRAYANGGIVASMGDQQNGTDYVVNYTNLAYAGNGATAFFAGQPNNKNSYAFRSTCNSGNGERGSIILGDKSGTSWGGLTILHSDANSNQTNAYIGFLNYSGFFQGFSKWVQLTNATYAIETSGSIYVSGTIYATGDISGYSDIRLKENLKKIESPLDKLCKLEGFHFSWSERFENAPEQKESVGLMAHQVLSVLPEAVTEMADGYYGVSYSKIIPLLVEAVKELKGIVDGITK